jgi:nicotinamide riboside kinase
MNSNTLKIAIVGPESTGKSTLAAALAQQYNGIWVPEFARTYVAALNRPYTAEDIIAISKGQLQAEAEASAKGIFPLFADTTVLVEKIWLEHAFKQEHPVIEEGIKNADYQLYLLTDIDMPWQPDPQREHPHLREYFLARYIYWLERYQLPYQLISGSEEERLATVGMIIAQWFMRGYN